MGAGEKSKIDIETPRYLDLNYLSGGTGYPDSDIIHFFCRGKEKGGYSEENRQAPR